MEGGNGQVGQIDMEGPPQSRTPRVGPRRSRCPRGASPSPRKLIEPLACGGWAQAPDERISVQQGHWSRSRSSLWDLAYRFQSHWTKSRRGKTLTVPCLSRRLRGCPSRLTSIRSATGPSSARAVRPFKSVS